MSDVAAAVLHGALGFAEARLRETEQQALASVAGLAAALGVTPENLPQADAELTTARTEFALFHAALGQPISLTSAHDAGIHLGAALTHTNAAIKLIRPDLNVTSLINASLERPTIPAGIAKLLRLDGPGRPGFDGSALTYDVAGGAVQLPGPPPVQIASTQLSVRLPLGSSSPMAITVLLKGVTITVAGDPFITKLFGTGSSATADITIGLDTERGLTIAGATHGVVVPAHGSSPLLDVRGLTLDSPATAPGAIDLGVVVAGSLGSVMGFIVDGVGVRVTIDPGRVASGDSPVSLAPKQPRGVGASLSGGLVRGGGYLDVHDGTYSGVLTVRLGPVDATAFGILDTRAAGGFSMIVAISAEFAPAIEIALGFTLNGVGGVVGLERALDTDALRARLHDHAADHLLFPRDPVSAAPQILQTLGAVFPPLRGGIVVGPAVKMGWGRPVSFFSAALGVVLALPEPKVVVLGSFRVAVPAPELPIVDLKGAVFSEITSQHVIVLILLEDSRFAGFAVNGDLGIFLGLGSDQQFAISAGGFHPRYQPPPELANMRRLSIDLAPPPGLTIRATAYVALTTNSFQFGGRLEAAAEVGPIGVHGFVQVDAIVRWSPAFAFEADLGAGFEIRFEGEMFAGVALHLHLEGPAPWKAHGTATLVLPILPDIDVEVGPVSWGDTHNPAPPLAHPLDLVHKALGDPEAWRPQLAPGAEALVTLRVDPAEPALLVHPLGLFECRQRAVPLETTIARVGPSPVPTAESRIRLGQPTLTDGDGTIVEFGAVSAVKDHFAPGQFLDLTDDDRLRRPDFEDMLAGMRLGPSGGARMNPERATQSDLRYDTFFPQQESVRRGDPCFSLRTSARGVLSAGATGRTPLRADVLYATKPDPIVVAAAGAVKIRRADDLAAPSGASDEPMTYTHAVQAMSALAGRAALQLVALGSEL